MFRMVKKCRCGLLLVGLLIFLLWGCASKESEHTTESNTENLTENSTEESAKIDYISGSAETEPIVSILWRKMLRELYDKSIFYEPDVDWTQDVLDHIWKQWDEDYEAEAFMANLSTTLTGEQRILVFFGKEYGRCEEWSWHDRLTKLTPEMFAEADKYWMLSGSGGSLPYYQGNEFLEQWIADSILKISGTIEKSSYKAGTSLVHDSDGAYSGIWKCVLEEIGKIHEEQRETFLGDLAGEAFMTEFDGEQLTGTFWVLLEGMDPIKMDIQFADGDCDDCRENLIDREAEYTEAEREKAWISIRFDLYTERLSEETESTLETSVSATDQTEADPAKDDEAEWDADLIYRAKEIPEISKLNPQSIVTDGERLFVLSRETSSEETADNRITHWKYRIVSCSMEDTEQSVLYEFEQLHYRIGESTTDAGYLYGVHRMAATADGKLLVVFRGTENDADEYWMAKYDTDGNELWRTVIGEAEVYLTTALCTGEGIYLAGGKRILVYDPAGRQQSVLEIGGFPEGLSEDAMADGMSSLQITEDGRAYVVYAYRDSARSVTMELDVRTGALGEWQENVLAEGTWATVYDGSESGYDMLLTAGETVYGWNFGQEPVALVNLYLAGLESGSVRSLHWIGEGELLAGYLDSSEGNIAYELTKSGEDAAKKQTIVIAATSAGDLTERILRFNRESDRWYIKLEVYDFTNEAELTQFDLEVTSGKGPDILWLDTGMLEYFPFDFNRYAKQGLFEDMRVWFEQDEELSPEDYLTNVFDALGEDGKWYRLCTGFSFHTWFGKASVLGDVDRLTLEKLQALSERYSTAIAISGRRNTILKNALITRWDQFVDGENGTCSFDSEAFVQLLEWLADYPGSNDSMKYYPADCRSDRLLVLGASIDSFNTLIEYPAKWFGEETVAVGYPGADGNGGIVSPERNLISMFSQSDCKDGAWEFIRYYFTERFQGDAQNGSTISAFSVKKSSLEGQLEAALNPVRPYSYNLDGVDYEVETPSREELESWIDYMSSITCAVLVDTEVYNIIVEEAGAFFAGQKTAGDVAKIIQGRVWIYLAEGQ